MSAIQQLLTEHIDIWTGADAAKRTGRGRASGNAGSVYGVKKLRELILELAVRGKLVPQDANDEPASALLKRIQAEKEKLVKAGKIKKDKPLAEITEEDKPFELPQGWEWVKLGRLCRLENGDRSKNYPNKSVLVANGMPFVNAGHLQGGRIDKNEMTFITKERFDLLRGGKFVNGDILYCLRGSLGKSAIVEGFETGAIASSLVIVRIYPYLSHDYFVKYFDSQLSYQMIRKYDNGTAQPNLSATDLEKFLIPLAPLAEQHRIVAKVDELMALCDQLETQHNNALEAHEKIVSILLQALTQSADANAFADNWQRIAAHFDTLFTTEASIDVLKQTLLQLAVMGKLVPQDANDEPASELLKKIRAEKDKLIKAGKIKKDKPLPEITEQEKPFGLPSGWGAVRVGEIINLVSGQHLKPNEYSNKEIKEGVPYITGPAEFGVEFPTYSKYTKEKRALAKNGDILITCKGSGIGKINSSNTTIAISRQLMAIQPVLIFVRFLRLFIDSKYEYFQSKGVGIAIPGISREDILDLVFVIPPEQEQHRIVAKVDELMALCDQLKARIGEAGRLQQKIADVVAEGAVA